MTTPINKKVASAIKRISEEQKSDLLTAAIRIATGYIKEGAETTELPIYDTIDGEVRLTGYRVYQRKNKYVRPDSKILELLLLNVFPDLIRTKKLEIESKNPLALNNQNSPEIIKRLAGKLADFAKELDDTRSIEAQIVEKHENDS